MALKTGFLYGSLVALKGVGWLQRVPEIAVLCFTRWYCLKWQVFRNKNLLIFAELGVCKH